MKTRFRQLVVASAVLMITVELLLWFYRPEDDALQMLLSIDGYGALAGGGLPLYFLMVVTKLLVLSGLFTFSPAARVVFPGYVLIVTLATLVWGWRVIPPIVGPFSTLEFVVDGMIIGMAFYSPVERRFRQGKHDTAPGNDPSQ